MPSGWARDVDFPRARSTGWLPARSARAGRTRLPRVMSGVRPPANPAEITSRGRWPAMRSWQARVARSSPAPLTTHAIGRSCIRPSENQRPADSTRRTSCTRSANRPASIGMAKTMPADVFGGGVTTAATRRASAAGATSRPRASGRQRIRTDRPGPSPPRTSAPVRPLRGHRF